MLFALTAVFSLFARTVILMMTCRVDWCAEQYLSECIFLFCQYYEKCCSHFVY